MLELLMNRLILPLVNTFSQHYYWPHVNTRLIKFSTPSRVNLQGCKFLKKINPWLFVLHLTMFIFLRMIYSQNRRLRDSKNQTFLCCLTMVGRLTGNFLKILSADLTNCWWHLCKFLENKKSKNYLNFSFFHYQGFQNSERK